jgi:prophage antirepressor-like protein
MHIHNESPAAAQNLQTQGLGIQAFNNAEFGEIRVAVNEKGEPIFCLTDLCKVLDLAVNGVSQRLEKGVISTYPLLTAGGMQRANFVNEDGMYDVILDSRKPEAKQFRKWVTSEVLPNIRKTGGYVLAGQDDTPDVIMARAILVAKDTIARVEAEKTRLQFTAQEQEKQLKEAAPKVQYYDDTLSSKSKLTVNSIALCLGISHIKLNKLLCSWGVQYQQSGVYFLASKYRDSGLAKHHPFPYVDSNGNPQTRQHLYWSEAGKKFILAMYEKNCVTLETA